MGKKKKKTGKKALKAFIKSNKVMLAALGGAAAGITMATALGSEKAKELVNTLENSLSTISDKIQNGLTSNGVREKHKAAVGQ